MARSILHCLLEADLQGIARDARLDSSQAWPASPECAVKLTPSLPSERSHCVIELIIEDELFVRRHAKPGIRLHLGIQLARPPPRITEGKQAAARSGAGGDVA